MYARLLLLFLLTLPNQEVVKEYDRREKIIGAELGHRREHLRRRLTAIYRLQRGGYARLLAESDSRADFFARRAAAARILSRDLEELRLFVRERRALQAERAELSASVAAAASGAPGISLEWPVAGSQSILHRMGPYSDAQTGLELTRHGVLLGGTSGTSVLAPAQGAVAFVGALPEIGETVILEHGAEVFTVMGGLTDARVTAGAHVAAGDAVGRLASGRLLFELWRGGTPLDPEPLLRHTGKR